MGPFSQARDPLHRLAISPANFDPHWIGEPSWWKFFSSWRGIGWTCGHYRSDERASLGRIDSRHACQPAACLDMPGQIIPCQSASARGAVRFTAPPRAGKPIKQGLGEFEPFSRIRKTRSLAAQNPHHHFISAKSAIQKISGVAQHGKRPVFPPGPLPVATPSHELWEG